MILISSNAFLHIQTLIFYIKYLQKIMAFGSFEPILAPIPCGLSPGVYLCARDRTQEQVQHTWAKNRLFECRSMILLLWISHAPLLHFNHALETGEPWVCWNWRLQKPASAMLITLRQRAPQTSLVFPVKPKNSSPITTSTPYSSPHR